MNAEEILIPLMVFSCIFGVVYLFVTSRHRERMALIEKGADASIFHSGSAPGKSRKFIVLNIALTSMGIGLGIASAIGLYKATGEDAVYPACIFFMAGAGLFASYMLNSRADRK
jgi:hypothetical protein